MEEPKCLPKVQSIQYTQLLKKKAMKYKYKGAHSSAGSSVIRIHHLGTINVCTKIIHLVDVGLFHLIIKTLPWC